MTTITIDRALLEQAIDELLPISHNSTDDPRGQADKAIALIRAELAKPVEPATAPKPAAWINGHDLRLLGRQGRGALVWCDNEGNADTPLYLHPPTPAWHDAPTEPGIWLCDEGGPDCYTYTAHNIVLLNDPALKDDECRWYGPIPQDGAKAEGGAG